MCGEHYPPCAILRPLGGSSPHVRGALWQGGIKKGDEGIIPACAGSTHRVRHGARLRRDHPRMCGEHLLIFQLDTDGRGSSPHVRGARVFPTACIRPTGIIPACAGSTKKSSFQQPLRRDHPRMCGEHTVKTEPVADGGGSSPHVRGAPRSRTLSRPCAGIIPACAGSTLRMPESLPMTRDHPRMCGEHPARHRSFPGHPGSSPHVRGARVFPTACIRPTGIIPACAGSTFSFFIAGILSGDHPRMCGEHTVKPSSAMLLAGSSPHVRGALCA